MNNFLKEPLETFFKESEEDFLKGIPGSFSKGIIHESISERILKEFLKVFPRIKSEGIRGLPDRIPNGNSEEFRERFSKKANDLISKGFSEKKNLRRNFLEN